MTNPTPRTAKDFKKDKVTDDDLIVNFSFVVDSLVTLCILTRNFFVESKQR